MKTDLAQTHYVTYNKLLIAFPDLVNILDQSATGIPCTSRKILLCQHIVDYVASLDMYCVFCTLHAPIVVVILNANRVYEVRI